MQVVLTLLVMTVLVSIALMIRHRRNSMLKEKKEEVLKLEKDSTIVIGEEVNSSVAKAFQI